MHDIIWAFDEPKEHSLNIITPEQLILTLKHFINLAVEKLSLLEAPLIAIKLCMASRSQADLHKPQEAMEL